MSVTRHIFPVGLCLLAGVIASYAAAWWFEYERTSRVFFAELPSGQRVLQEGAFAWPVPTSQWPQPSTPPSSPDRAFMSVESAGIEFRSYVSHKELDCWQVNEIASGWPMRCTARLSFLQEHISVYPGSPTPDSRVWYGGWPAVDVRLPTPLAAIGPIPVHFPLRPLWGGLAINAALYGSAAWLVSAGFMTARRSLRRRRGLCGWCGYPRSSSSVCTECGRN